MVGDVQLNGVAPAFRVVRDGVAVPFQRFIASDINGS